MINNLEQICDLLNFRSEDDFYHLQILKRKKDNENLNSNSICIKTYYIKSVEHLKNVFPEIKTLCNFSNARGCINLNRRSFEKICFYTLKKITDQIISKDFENSKNAYNSVCGIHNNESEKKWIIDIDRNDCGIHGKWLSEKLIHLEPNPGIEKLISILPTKNGYHLIVSPFNVNQAKEFLFDDIHKDNPTILYIP